VLAAEIDRVDDVRRAGAGDDEARLVGMHGVVRGPHALVARVTRQKSMPVKRHLQLPERLFRKAFEGGHG
jgi:hypothetical protein